MNKKRSSAF